MAACKKLKYFCSALVRRKPLDISSSGSELKRCLTTLDLTALGIGSTLGLGIYVIAGQVASTKAGPAVTLSFFIAAAASVFSGLCYAEFGARVPRAGSAYVYSYVTVGELMAFIIGWNLILEYVIGTASVARGYSGYLDSLLNKTIEISLTNALPMKAQHMSSYPDFLALGITLLLTVMLAVGVKESTRFNNIFTGVNLLIVIFAVIAGSIKADVHNWQLDQSEVPDIAGDGGFFPFGFKGVVAGAATCFYGFVGFDCIATTGEEVKNPQKSIPISIVLSLLFVFLAYFGVSAVETLMWPYWDQNQSAPLPYVFQQVGWPVARWIIAIGALAGLSTSLLGAMFPLPRVMYAMAYDGVIFKFLAKVHPRFKTPLFATLISGCFAGIMAMMFDVHELADMMSIGTLLAYSLVAVSVMILRYRYEEQPDSADGVKCTDNTKKNYGMTGSTPNNCTSYLDAHSECENSRSKTQLIQHLLNMNKISVPTKESSKISLFLIIILTLVIIVMDILVAWCEKDMIHGDMIPLYAICTLLVVLLVILILLYRQPTDQKKISFKVPLVPFIPAFSIMVNIYLMLELSSLTWIRFAIWMIIGLCIYFFYGMWNSLERNSVVKNAPAINGIEMDGFIVGNHISSQTAIITSEEKSSPGQGN